MHLDAFAVKIKLIHRG